MLIYLVGGIAYADYTCGNPHPIGESVFGLAYRDPWLMERGIMDFFCT